MIGSLLNIKQQVRQKTVDGYWLIEVVEKLKYFFGEKVDKMSEDVKVNWGMFINYVTVIDMKKEKKLTPSSFKNHTLSSKKPYNNFTSELKEGK